MDQKDLWWAGLTVAQKERIAKKVTGTDTYYPACTEVWNTLPVEKKEWIYNHCKHGHSYLDPVEIDGNPLT